MKKISCTFFLQLWILDQFDAATPVSTPAVSVETIQWRSLRSRILCPPLMRRSWSTRGWSLNELEDNCTYRYHSTYLTGGSKIKISPLRWIFLFYFQTSGTSTFRPWSGTGRAPTGTKWFKVIYSVYCLFVYSYCSYCLLYNVYCSR